MARDWAGLCPYSKVSKVTVGLESYGAEPRVVRTKHRSRMGTQPESPMCTPRPRRSPLPERLEAAVGSLQSRQS